MKRFEMVLSQILSVAIVVGGTILVAIGKQQEYLNSFRAGLTEAEVRNPTLMLLIVGLLMVALGLINLLPGGLRAKPGSFVEIMLKKLLSVVILGGGIALVFIWTLQQQILMTQANISEYDARIPTLLLFIPGTLFSGMGVLNLLPDSLRGVPPYIASRHEFPEPVARVRVEVARSLEDETRQLIHSLHLIRMSNADSFSARTD